MRPVAPWLAALLALCALAGCGPSASNPQPQRLYSVVAGTLTDAEGHALFLHGINVREDAKHIPEHILPLSTQEVGLIRAQGFNSVRLLTHWEALYPAEDQLDQAYLDTFVAELDKLTAAGLYVIVDLHQDLWGSPFSNGGAEWTCPEEIRAGYQPVSPWWLNYNSSQVRGCFDRFWADADGIQDQWLAAWTELARAVCHQPRVIGFDLFNEPWPGSAIGDPDFDREVLYPFYQRAMQAIEAACPERIFFLEPSAGFTFGIAEPIRIVGSDLDRVVIAPHHYPQVVHEPGQTYDWDQAAFDASFQASLGDWLAGPSPVWVGEYGALTDNPGVDGYLEQITAAFYERFAGSALWAFNRSDGGFAWLDANGVPKPAFARAFGVPVPVRLPGRPGLLAPDFTAGSLRLRFDCVEGRELSVLLPSTGAWRAEISPQAAMELAGQQDNRLRLGCLDSVGVEVEISR